MYLPYHYPSQYPNFDGFGFSLAEVDRLSGSDHILMSEMQQRVAALTGIPVHADDAGHGGLESDSRFFGGSCRDTGQSCLLDRQNCSNMTIIFDDYFSSRMSTLATG